MFATEAQSADFSQLTLADFIHSGGPPGPPDPPCYARLAAAFIPAVSIDAHVGGEPAEVWKWRLPSSRSNLQFYEISGSPSSASFMSLPFHLPSPLTLSVRYAVLKLAAQVLSVVP